MAGDAAHHGYEWKRSLKRSPGQVGRLPYIASGKTKPLFSQGLWRFKLVAGLGFEPRTFRL